MGNKGTIVLQDAFLNKIRREHIPVTIHLMNGFQIRGHIKGFDNFVIVVENDEKQMMIYKHAISTVTPAKPVNWGNENKGKNNNENANSENTNE